MVAAGKGLILLYAVLLIAVIVDGAISARSNSDPSIVITDTGAVRGQIGDGFRAFKGIPYAESPEGELRWRPPIPRAPWQGIMNATQWGSHCPQACSLPTGFCPPNSLIGEDCLRLNVFTPAADLGQKQESLLPVFVFIHGGHFDAGSGGVPAYDGRALARKGIVFVSINYRLGVFGFMVNKDHGVSGNYAIMDMVLALRWVQRNIRAFGGDPNRVTVGGESAGATAVSTLQTAPIGKGLFHRAIQQSTPFSLFVLEVDEANKLGKKVAKELKCSDLTCLQNSPWQSLVAAQEKVGGKPNLLHPMLTFFPWTPVPDGVHCAGQPIDAYIEGAFHDMPLLLGSTSEEAVMFVYLALEKPASKLVFNAGKAALFLKRLKDVNAQYPSISGDNREPMAKLLTDYLFTAPARHVADNVARQSKEPVFLFHFNHSLSQDDAWMPGYPFCRGRVCHGTELPFVFDSAGLAGVEFTPAEKRLADAITTYWTNFIKTGDPSQGLPVNTEWPAFTGDNLLSLQLEADKVRVVRGLAADKCNFWDDMGYGWGRNLFGRIMMLEESQEWDSDFVSVRKDDNDVYHNLN